NINDIKFIVANTVILEGINLPIDNLFILNTYSLKGTELTNLIGRVNRLDTVFNKKTNQLNKLLPQIHFVNSVEYNSSKQLMQKKIELLRNNYFVDNVMNPTLEAFDITKIKKEKERNNLKDIISNEDLIIADGLDEVEEFKKYLINSGIYSMYEVNDDILPTFKNQIESLRSSDEWKNINIVDKIYQAFIENFEEYIKDYEIHRLKFEEARNFYKLYIANRQRYSLNKNIEETFKYFKSRKQTSYFYMGELYGEIEKPSDNYSGRVKPVYVDVSKKSDAELINLVIVKLKLEDDFISYKLSKFIIALLDFKLIDEDEYHKIVYGTNDSKKINLIKTGLSINLITKLQEDNQVKNLYFDENNNINMNDAFRRYKNSLHGFYKFELDKYL
ncbi:DNA helicase, partial [Paenibacillus lautus]